jgi:hypothetical protein
VSLVVCEKLRMRMMPSFLPLCPPQYTTSDNEQVHQCL